MLAQLGFLIVRGEPIGKHVRSAVNAIKTRSEGRPANSVGYLRRVLDDEMGPGKVKQLLKLTPSRKKCAAICELARGDPSRLGMKLAESAKVVRVEPEETRRREVLQAQLKQLCRLEAG